MGYQEYRKDAMTCLTWHASGYQNQAKRPSSFLALVHHKSYPGREIFQRIGITSA